MWATSARSCARRGRRGCDDALALVGLADVADRLPAELSQGERKLVGVARALARSPRVVCLDEPAAGLDSAESARSATGCARSSTSGNACCWSTTTWASCSASATMIVVLDFGKVIAPGRPTRSPRPAASSRRTSAAPAPTRGRRGRHAEAA